jgi:hypothetical protein
MNIMDIINVINAAVLIIGLPLILKATLYIGKRLQVLDNLENTINNRVLPDIADIKGRMVALETKVNVMWEWFSRHMILESQNK